MQPPPGESAAAGFTEANERSTRMSTATAIGPDISNGGKRIIDATIPLKSRSEWPVRNEVEPAAFERVAKFFK